MECLKKLLEICRVETEKITKESIVSTINHLLSVDDLQETKTLCAAIANQKCNNRIQQWISSHVNAEIFVKMFNSELQNLKEKTVFMLPPLGKNMEHNPATLSGVKVVKVIRVRIFFFLINCFT